MALHRLKRGLDLPLAGAPKASIEDARPVRQVGLLAADHAGLKPGFHVQPGDRVLRGQLLFEDKRHPGVRFTSPAAGTVNAVQRGDRRAFQAIIIDVSKDDAAADAQQVIFDSLGAAQRTMTDGVALRTLLLESGLWSTLRTRPYSEVPAPDAQALALFVTATDSQPHAPPAGLVLQGRETDFQRGLRALETLTPGPVYLCVDPGSGLQAEPGARTEVHEFAGPHPAGTVGWHIHRLHPVSSTRCVWHIGCQDVAAIGHLLNTGRLDLRRVISLAGPSVRRPRLLRTRLGANLLELTEGELQPGAVRRVSGSVLAGRAVQDDGQAFLGCFHQQLSALPELGATPPAPLSGLRLGRGLFSVTLAFAGAWSGSSRRTGFAMNTSSHGPQRPMLPLPLHDDLLPFDTEPALLLRALLAKDAEQVEALGGLALDEEDLALASFVCPSKQDYGQLLRHTLRELQELGA